MQKAFDTILQSEVSATLVAHSGGFEQYRYECACCGEEVFVAAPYSKKQVAHFRHRSGNNDVKCENYLGQFGMLSANSRSRKSNRERVEFYFDFTNKIISIGLRFSEKEIQDYEQQSVDFELRAKESEKPFRVLKINRLNFTPEVPTMIPLIKFSLMYYLSNTSNGAKRKYDLFKHNTPTFFRILGNDRDFKAKLVRGAILYTDTPYFVVVESHCTVYSVFDGIEIENAFYFDTMERRFAGMFMRIINKTAKVDNLINSWGYQLEASETLTMLWPPAAIKDETTVINSDYAFLYTSFALQAHGNINTSSEDIVQDFTGVSKILIKEKVKVLRKNAEIVLHKADRHSSSLDKISILKDNLDKFTVLDDSMYFMFSNAEVMPLKRGQTVILFPQSTIKHYFFGYLDKVIVPLQKEEFRGRELLDDILSHYKRTEVYCDDIQHALTLSDTAIEYLMECEGSGFINSVAKQCIEEAKL